MFLKSLTLKGFKSFAETTTLEFEPGITVVVGPNGSGKSNIVDAVAWVLGAQGPRTVRSGKMEDVIFAGTAKRPALGRAEVTLTIDNSAGLIPIEFTEVTITRTLWRSGESEYALNGTPCRLLDIQELLSDSGVGRQQHVIVGQGQIDAVLNAQPTDRRLIIEEAAGVLKYRRRREKAQRRLDATEGNLLRVQDLLREVRRQLRPLERQADAARRHGDVVAELGALRLFLTGRELSSLRSRAVAVERSRIDRAAAEQTLITRLAGLDASVMAAEAALTAASRDQGLADHVAQAEGLRERARGLTALIAERRRSLERAQAAEMDASVLASLEAEAAALRASLGAAAEELASLQPLFAELDAEEASMPTIVDPGPRAAEVRAELAALTGTASRLAAERDRLQQRADSLARRASQLAVAEPRAPDDSLSRAVIAAAGTADAAEAALAAAEQAATAATGHHRALAARADALEEALASARARAGLSRLEGVAGIVGTLLDVVEVDPGWEEAFEAAIGEAVSAVVVDGVDAARRALEAATVLPADLVAGVDPYRGPGRLLDHVRSSTAHGLLEYLLARAVVVGGGWEEALDLFLSDPTLTVVTRTGDRFASGGWRIGSGQAAASGLADARQRAATAEAELESARAALESCRTAATAARTDLAAAQRALDAQEAAINAAAAARQRAEEERREIDAEIADTATRLAELDVRHARDRARITELEEALPALEADVERAAAMGLVAASLHSRRTELEVRVAAATERRTVQSRRLEEIEVRLEPRPPSVIPQQLTALAALATHLGSVSAEVEATLGRLQAERREALATASALGEQLDDLRRSRAAAERELTETRELLQRASLEEAELRVRIETTTESCRRDLDCEPEAAMAAVCPELPPGTTADHRARELERDLRLMGPINPLALEEHAALLERHGFLEAQLEDVKAGRRELAKVIRAIDTEIVDVFSAAYADVADNFARLFGTLFPGGTGRLRLTDPDNLLETGLELEARPSGKNVKRLSLLSGGERSLTAMAFLFAVFRSRPSPFYLMDEVEAALDDVNLHRFLDLLHEFRTEAQLVIVSHQKRTMEAADSLYGVTMQPGGSSKVISERAVDSLA